MRCLEGKFAVEEFMWLKLKKVMNPSHRGQFDPHRNEWNVRIIIIFIFIFFEW